MVRQKVASSVLRSVGYNEEQKLLETELLNGSIYTYYEVPLTEYMNLMQAGSLGEYYNKHIKEYSYKRIR